MPAPTPRVEGNQSRQHQRGANRDHQVIGRVHQHRVRPILFRELLHALDRRLRIVVREDRQQVRDFDAADDLLLLIVGIAEQRQWRTLRRFVQTLHRGELQRLVLRHHDGDEVTRDELDRHHDRGEGEADREAFAMVFVTSPLEHADGIDGCDGEARADEGGEQHVEVLRRKRRVKHRGDRIDVSDRTVGIEREARGRVHPRVRGDDEEGREEAAEHEWDSAKEVCAWRQPIPPVQVDREEDRLDEEGEPLQAERHTDDAARELHKARPEQTELEGQHGAGDSTDAERHRKGLRPGAGELEIDLVACAQPEALGDHQQRWHPNAEHGEADVERERGAHLDACRHQFSHRLTSPRQMPDASTIAGTSSIGA